MAFGSEHSTSYKVVEFPSVELKNKYVEAEYADPKCQLAFLSHQSAWNKQQRTFTREVLASTRLAFYNKWAAKYIKSNKPRALTEEDFPA